MEALLQTQARQIEALERLLRENQARLDEFKAQQPRQGPVGATPQRTHGMAQGPPPATRTHGMVQGPPSATRTHAMVPPAARAGPVSSRLPSAPAVARRPAIPHRAFGGGSGGGVHPVRGPSNVGAGAPRGPAAVQAKVGLPAKPASQYAAPSEGGRLGAAEQSVESQLWYFGDCGRAVAEQLLGLVGKGWYLCRRSSTTGGQGVGPFAISCFLNDMQIVTHSLVKAVPSPAGSGQVWVIDGATNDATYPTAIDCIEKEFSGREKLRPLDKADPRVEKYTLHPEWRSAITADGRRYYFNRVTKGTSWKPVFRFADSFGSANPAQPTAAATESAIPARPKLGLRTSDRAVLVSRSDPSKVELKVVVSRNPPTSYVLNLPREGAIVRAGLEALARQLGVGPEWVDSHEFVVVDLSVLEDPGILMESGRPLLSYPLTSAHEVELRRLSEASERRILVTVRFPDFAISAPMPILPTERIIGVISRFGQKHRLPAGELDVTTVAATLFQDGQPVAVMDPNRTVQDHGVRYDDMIQLGRRGAPGVADRSTAQRASFGTAVAQVVSRDSRNFGQIPVVLLALEEVVVQGLTVDGIFRFTAGAAQLTEAQDWLEQTAQTPGNTSEEGVRAAAWLIRSWFDQLPPAARVFAGVPMALLTKAANPAKGSLALCQGLVEHMSVDAQRLFKWLLNLLGRVARAQPGSEQALAQSMSPVLQFTSPTANPFEVMHVSSLVSSLLWVLLADQVKGMS